MTAEIDPTRPLPIRRELLDVRAWQDADGHVVIEMTCDCATVTQATIVGRPTTEIGVSCQGCNTSHWVTVNLLEPS